MIGVASQTTCTRKAFAAQGKNGRCNTVAKAAAAEVATVKKGPMLEKKYHGPHSVAEDGIERIVSMLRKGDLFRYGGQDEGSLQVCVCVCCPLAILSRRSTKHCARHAKTYRYIQRMASLLMKTKNKDIRRSTVTAAVLIAFTCKIWVGLPSSLCYS